MGRIKAMTKKSADPKWVEELMRLEKYKTETLERIERIRAREKERLEASKCE